MTSVPDAPTRSLRLLWADLLALSACIVVGGTLLYDLYWLGHAASSGANSASSLSYVRIAGALAALAASFSWIAYRVVAGACRDLAGEASLRQAPRVWRSGQ